jgi:hypothetical protein
LEQDFAQNPDHPASVPGPENRRSHGHAAEHHHMGGRSNAIHLGQSGIQFQIPAGGESENFVTDPSDRCLPSALGWRHGFPRG